MHLLNRLILLRLTGLTLAIFLFAAAIVMTTHVLSEAIRIVEGAGGLPLALRLFVLLFPMIAVSVLPVAFLIALLVVYSGMHRSSETAVMMSAGMGPLAQFRPALWVAGSLSVLVLAFSLLVEPTANRLTREILDTLRFGALRLLVADGTLRSFGEGLYIRAGSPVALDGIDGLVIFHQPGPGQQVLFAARSGGVEPGSDNGALWLDQGTMLISGQGQGTPHTITFGRMRMDTAGFLADGSAGPGPVQTGTWTLIEAMRSGTLPAAQLDSARFEIIRRLTDWLWPLVFLAIAGWALAGAGPERAQRNWRLGVCVALAAVVRLLGLLVLGMAGAGGAAVPAALLLPAVAIVLFLWLMWRRAAAPPGDGGLRGAFGVR